MDWIFIIGMMAACGTTVSFIPQAIKTIRTRNTIAISLGMYSFFTAGTLMWLIYGIVSHNVPIIISNAVTLVFAAIILFYKIHFK